MGITSRPESYLFLLLVVEYEGCDFFKLMVDVFDGFKMCGTLAFGMNMAFVDDTFLDCYRTSCLLRRSFAASQSESDSSSMSEFTECDSFSNKSASGCYPISLPFPDCYSIPPFVGNCKLTNVVDLFIGELKLSVYYFVISWIC